LRVSVNVQQNAVTASAEPAKVDAIDRLIRDHWDLPRPEETAKVYILNYTDPLKVRDLLQDILGSGGGRSTSGRGAGGATGRATQPNLGGGGGSSTISQAIGDIYRIEAYPDQNKVIVLSKTKDALTYLDYIIEQIDQPSTIGLPQILELKHANAVSLADELNVLLAETGTGGGLTRPGEGLTAEGPGGFSSGGNAGTSGNAGTTGGTRAGTTSSGGAGTGGGTIEFPWQRGRARDDQTEPSSLIGKVRIVPIVRQNALAILAPVAQRHAVVELIRDFDKPGRQVLISAIIAEVTLTDDFAFGIKFSSSGLTPANPENALAGTVGFQGTKDNLFGNLFDTSVLDVNADINVLLQALSKKTNVRIIQKPRIFTADNQEAAFFDGQQIPFITNSVVNSTNNGGVTQSFDYKDVGVLLNVRPHITVQRDVDMEIKLALSAVVPGQTLFGGAILDLRQTTTKVIVKNAQTIVLSGLLKDVDSKVKTGVPLLSDIPFIGDLFRTHENSKSTSELVAFITPIVVDNPSENDSNFNKLERENLQRIAQPLKEQAKERKRLRQSIIETEKATVPLTPPENPDEDTTVPPSGDAKPPDDANHIDIDNVNGGPKHK
jgi:general secretion pathway protein D